MKLPAFFALILVLGTAHSCVQKKEPSKIANTEQPAATGATPGMPSLIHYPTPPDFANYWYQGKAELSTYAVEQERYGEKRSAEQVNIFVTEDFSRKKQVKLDDPANAGNDRVPVLKWNAIRRFKTGIYDYSIMQSVFAPIEGGQALKASSSIQDWCGHVFMQANLLSNGAYDLKGFSYFESEADSKISIENSMLEEDLWLKIRLGPEKIKEGVVSLIPSAVYARLRHKPLQAEKAVLNIEKKESESVLHIRYENLPRSLSIRFESVSPYRILGWEESLNGSLQSKGTLKKALLSPYWSQNSNAFSGMRDSLILNF